MNKLKFTQFQKDGSILYALADDGLIYSCDTRHSTTTWKPVAPKPENNELDLSEAFYNLEVYAQRLVHEFNLKETAVSLNEGNCPRSLSIALSNVEKTLLGITIQRGYSV